MKLLTLLSIFTLSISVVLSAAIFVETIGLREIASAGTADLEGVSSNSLDAVSNAGLVNDDWSDDLNARTVRDGAAGAAIGQMINSLLSQARKDKAVSQSEISYP